MLLAWAHFIDWQAGLKPISEKDQTFSWQSRRSTDFAGGGAQERQDSQFGVPSGFGIAF